MSAATQSCTRCARVNPSQGIYCFSCGVALGNIDRQAVAVGSRPFPTPFVFPSGKSCRSFDELALACQAEWSTARRLLQEGYLESFLGGMGRMDLALSAKEASRFPDEDRGLDQFLANLPTTVLPEPKLRIDPTELNLGTLEGTQSRTYTLELENQGGRLLYGTLRTDDPWLTVGEANAREKAFHFTDEERISIHVGVDRIRASQKPIEGKLVLSTNDGVHTIVVRAEKPVKPFNGGPLTGAKSPRQIAEMAMKNAKEVGPFFENGDVERWYAENGWVYPVKVPAASGLAAIQQFFEALGVTKAPKVEIDRRLLSLTGEPGQTLSLSVSVSTQEKRPVFVHVTSNVPWIEVGRAKFAGKTATVPMTIPQVPHRPGETLQGELTVISNGNAKWQVPVMLEVGGAANAFDFEALSAAPPSPPPPPPVPPPVSSVSAMPPPVLSLEEETIAPTPAPPMRRGKQRAAKGPPVNLVQLTVHAMPAILLVLALLSMAVYDRVKPALTAPVVGKSTILGPNYDPKSLADPKPRIGVSYSNMMQFGVVRLDQADPNNRSGHKRLTFNEFGETNSTMVRIGGYEYLFGLPVRGRDWAVNQKAVDLPAPYYGRQSTFRFIDDEVEVLQYIQIVPGQANTLDTVLVYYRARNVGTVPRKVQIRLLLDTFIGENDGAPFLVPGQSDLTKAAQLIGDKVPDFLEVIENPNDSKNPGTMVRIGLKNLRWGKIEPQDPDEVIIGQMGNSRAWRPDFKPISDDSAVTVYWPEVELQPKRDAHFAMTYGLGALEVSNDLGLSAPGSAMPQREFTVTGYVYKAKAGQEVTLDLPAGLELVPGQERVQTIGKASERAQVFWRVRATREGTFTLFANSERTRSKPVRVVVKSSGVFG